MKLNFKYPKLWALAASILALTVYLVVSTDYMTTVVRNVTVTHKFQGNGRSDHFYLVGTLEDGRTVDLSVTPRAYATTNIGDTVRYELREFDIRQTPRENLFYFFGPVIFGTCGVAMMIALTSAELSARQKRGK